MLEDRHVVVTGGSIGIGLAIAKECAQAGATLSLAARNKAELSSAVKQLHSISDRPHDAFSLDVSDLSAVNEFAAWLRKRPPLSGIVNCAGVYGPIGKTTSVSMEEFTKAININFLGTVYVCNALTPILTKNTRGKIVNIAGGGAASPFPFYSAYASSKAALVRFSENLALELASEQIDVNSVAPGFVITRLHEQTLAAGAEASGNAFYQSTKDQIAKGGVPAEKAAKLTAFLLSEKSDGISGKFISAPWDDWASAGFQERLRSDKDFATLRRIDDFQFMKKTG